MKNKYIYRWLKQYGVYIGSERKEREVATELIGDNLVLESGHQELLLFF